MRAKNNKKDFLSDLREKAKKKIATKKRTSKKIEKDSLVHELDVRDIELEMQNEELHSTQLKLAKTVENFAQLFEHAPVGYFILDKEGRILNVNNKGSQHQLGIDKKQLIGRPFSMFLTTETFQDEFYRHRNLVIETEELQKVEGEILRKDGKTFPVLITSTIIKDNKNSFKHFLTMTTDISERKEYEHKIEMALTKEKELNELKSQFISMASHEFKTPLASILSSAWLIENYNKTEDHEKRKKHSTKIKSAVAELEIILNEFLSLSQIEKNLIENHPKKLNIIRFIEECIAETNHNENIITYKHIGKRQDVFLDARLLKICFNNILNNAIKYSAKSKKIEVTSEKNTNKGIKIRIKDHGLGIPVNAKKNIFEQFFRAKNVENIPGSGLGLNIVEKIAHIMDGKISFQSELNKGSTFEIEFSEMSKGTSEDNNNKKH